ncbi:hypothetical protein ACIQUW_33395 [Streptomyces sp. NPDC101117]|uniref:hypothetical protein n=1 Tax=Streptomyces sp. NPDC101117 TaxID=3366108 RepID=UPI00382D88BE
MRRPAQHRPGLAAAHGQALLTDLTAAAVWCNTEPGQGGGAAPAQGVPTPAEIAARTAQQPPTTPAAPTSPGEQEVSFTQRRLNKMMSEEKEEGRRAAYRAIAEAAGLNPDDFDPAKFGEVFKQAEQARQQQLSEEQRRAEELQRQTQALETDKARLAQQQADLEAARRALAREQALIRLGAVDATDEQGQVTAPNLQDALAMLERDLRDTPDADPTAVAAAAEALKKRRPELFGQTTVPQTLPPAPSGGPAAGNAPRQPATGTKDAVKDEARKWADRLGYGGSSAA